MSSASSSIGGIEMHALGSQVWGASESAYLQNGSMDAVPGAPGTAPDFHLKSSQSSGADWARESPAQVVMVSILAWTFLYFASRALLPFSATYGKWDRERQYKARGLVPSSVFLLGIVPFSIWALTSDADLRGVRVTGATSSSLLISAIATGYFIYDTLVVLYHFKDDGVAYLVHGLLCMVTYGLATQYHVFQFYAPTFLLFESTTLFINVRWLLVELNLKDSKLYLFNGLALLIAWFVVRIVWGYSSSYLFWVDTISAYHEALLPVPLVLWYTMANIGLNFLNTMWFCKIVKGAIKALRPAVPRGKKD